MTVVIPVPHLEWVHTIAHPEPPGDANPMRLAHDLGEAFQIALNAMRANKARGALTTLGIIIGIVAVILTMTAANGL